MKRFKLLLPLSLISLIAFQSCSSYQGDLLMHDEMYLTKNETQRLDQAFIAKYNSPQVNEATGSDANSTDGYDYYDDSYSARTTRINGPGSSISPYNDPFFNNNMGMNTRFGMGMGMGMGGMSPMGYSSLCFNCYDPFMNPMGWMPMNAFYGYGATAFYDPFYDPFWGGGFYNSMHPFYNPYRFAPPAVVVWISNDGNNIIRGGSNSARSGSTGLTRTYRGGERNSSTAEPSNSSVPVIGNNRSNSRNYSPNREYQNRTPATRNSGSVSPSRNNSSRSYSPSRSSGSGSRSGGSRSSGGSYRR